MIKYFTIRAPELLNLFNLLQKKRYNSLICKKESIKHELLCEILYIWVLLAKAVLDFPHISIDQTLIKLSGIDHMHNYKPFCLNAVRNYLSQKSQNHLCNKPTKTIMYTSTTKSV